MTTGLRRGELCGLMWRDLEPDLATLTIRRQRVVEDPTSRVREKPPKSHNGTRSLLLDPVTLTTLTDTRPQSRTALVSGYMFTGRGGQPLRPDNVSSRFNQLAVAAGVRPLGPTRSGTCSPPACSIPDTASPRWPNASATTQRP